MDEIDRNASLSSEIKYRRRCEIADQAIADFEASKTLSRAREAVELAMSKHNFERVLPEVAQDSEATVKAMKEVERSWQRGSGDQGSVVLPPEKYAALRPGMIEVNALIEQLRKDAHDGVTSAGSLLYRLQSLLRKRLDLPYKVDPMPSDTASET